MAVQVAVVGVLGPPPEHLEDPEVEVEIGELFLVEQEIRQQQHQHKELMVDLLEEVPRQIVVAVVVEPRHLEVVEVETLLQGEVMVEMDLQFLSPE